MTVSITQALVQALKGAIFVERDVGKQGTPPYLRTARSWMTPVQQHDTRTA